MRRHLAIGASGVIMFLTAVFVSPGGLENLEPAVATAAAGAVSGRVFDDRDMNGSFDGSDVGVAGVEVTAYDSTGGSVGSATSGADGTYSLSVTAAANDLRVEFETPDGYQPSFAGSGNGTSIQFVAVGNTGIDYGIQRPAKYCANTGASMSLMAACIRPGTITGGAAGNGSLSTVGWSSRTAATAVNFSETGAVWGVAADMERGTVWASAVVRRHAGLGSEGLGGLYVLPQSGGGGITASFDLSDTPYNLAFAADPASFTDANRGIVDSSLLSLDLPGYTGVGRAGIGDIDIDDTDSHLFVTNLHTRQIHRFELGGTTTAPTLGALTTFDLPVSTCSGTTARPWALNADAIAGRVIVGVVCSGEEQSFDATSNADGGVILELNPSDGSWSTLTTVGFTYERGNERCTNTNWVDGTEPNNSYRCESQRWHDWTDDFAGIRAAGEATPPLIEKMTEGTTEFFWFSQPMIVDLEMLADGSLIVGVSDRFNYQLGAENVTPDETSTDLNSPNKPYATSRVTGDLILLCDTGSGYAQESDGSCGSSYTAETRTAANAGISGASPYREFFDDNVGGSFNGAHTEIIIGGLAVHPDSGSQLIAVAAMDADNSLGTNGVRWLDPTDGSMDGVGTKLTQGSTNAFEKSVSMGDLELICDGAPLQIGNRLWYDLNRNGIQDAGEPPLVGVDVNLYNDRGGLVGRAITDTDGTYYFSSNVTEAATGNGDNIGGGLEAYSTFQLRIGIANSYAAYFGGSSAPLDFNTWRWTTANAVSAESPNDAAIDSDTSDLVNIFGDVNWARLIIDPMASGQVDHTFDFGIVPLSSNIVTLGDLVWHDLDGDGTQDAGEPGVAGAVLTLTDGNGDPVVDILGRTVQPVTTGPDGRYLFDNLAADPVSGTSYRVTITYPPGYSPTLAGQGGSTSDSSTDVATTPWELYPGESDFDMDFGVVQSVSVGDRVWLDLDEDGIQDAGEPGLARAILTLTDADGDPVTDVFGNLVTPITTDSTGAYLFDDLLSGQYTVTITYPEGFTATVAGAGSDPAVDSSTDTATSAALVAGDPNNNEDLTLDFGVAPPDTVSLGDVVWIDTDSDGVQDAGETGLAGAILTLFDANGDPATDIFGAAVTPITTDATGAYLFDNLLSGRYSVAITYPSGYGPTRIGVGSDPTVDSAGRFAYSADLVAGDPATDQDLTLDFGVVSSATLPVAVGDLVWIDSDADGVQDDDEPGLAGATLTLTDANGDPVVDQWGDPVAPIITDSSGRYLFDGLPPGQYKVSITYPAGYRPTTAGAGADSAADSSTDEATTVNLAAGEQDLTLDFGVIAPVRVGDFVWIDGNANGLQDASESGLAGAVLTLTDANDNPVTDMDGQAVAPITTDATGTYLFDNLPPGQYKVAITYPVGWTPTTAGAGSDRSLDSSTDDAVSVVLASGEEDLTLDFGVIAPVRVGDLVWIDTDRDGIQDSSEPGLAGAVLTLTDVNGNPVTDMDGNPVGSITTDSTGAYLFDNLPPGQYKVAITYPVGFTATKAAIGSDRAVDSSTDEAVSSVLPAGAEDLTLDFGVVPVESPTTPGQPGSTTTTAPGSSTGSSTGSSSTGSNSTPSPSDPSTSPTPSTPGDRPAMATIPSAAVAGYPGTFVGGSGSGTGANDTPAWVGSDLAPSSVGVNVGGYVWFDSSDDGRQGEDERGFVGVLLRIERADGQPARDVDGAIVESTTTDATGHFLFPRLQLGSYVVHLVAFDGYAPTVSGVGGRAGDSSSGSAVSLTMTEDGSFDLTLDFGFVTTYELPATGGARTPMTLALIMICGGVLARGAGRRRSLRSEMI